MNRYVENASSLRSITKYGYKNGEKKNTLFAFHVGNTLVFGISRCRRGDTFSKKEGRYAAINRAEKMLRDLLLECNCVDNIHVPEGTWQLHEDGLRGYCHVEDYERIRSYLSNIDATLAKECHRRVKESAQDVRESVQRMLETHEENEILEDITD